MGRPGYVKRSRSTSTWRVDPFTNADVYLSGLKATEYVHTPYYIPQYDGPSTQIGCSHSCKLRELLARSELHPSISQQTAVVPTQTQPMIDPGSPISSQRLPLGRCPVICERDVSKDLGTSSLEGGEQEIALRLSEYCVAACWASCGAMFSSGGPLGRYQRYTFLGATIMERNWSIAM